MLILLTFLSAAPLNAAQVTLEIQADRATFRLGSDVVTEYRFGGNVPNEKQDGTKPLAKPFFHPIHAPGVVPVTRAWPMIRGARGETVDHYHQKSAWFCHGDVIPEGLDLKTRSADKHVRGVDFWSEARGHGRIVSLNVKAMRDALHQQCEWRTPDDVPILDEDRMIRVSALDRGYLIVLESKLKARDYPIIFGDTKEGSLGVRVADGLRLAGPGSRGVVTASDGTRTAAPFTGTLPQWGRHADWHDYSGPDAGVAVFADPKNPFPSAWHTRDYGLMAANPFGRSASGFPALKNQHDLARLDKRKTLTLRFAIYAHTGDVTTGRVAEAYSAFTKAQ